MKINPFDPNQPCKPKLFGGRGDEIDIFQNLLFRVKESNLSGGVVLGNRGLGKTSLINYIKRLAKGEIQLSGIKYNFVIIEVIITPNTNQFQLIKKVQVSLKRQLRKYEKARSAFDKGWEFIGRWEVLGNKVDTDKKTDQEIFFDEFCYSLADTAKRITQSNKDSWLDSSFDGILLIIDECDTASPQLDLGTFAKLLFERMQAEDSNNLLLTLVGLPETKKILYQSHPSSLRIFTYLTLDYLNTEEIKDIVDKVLAYGNTINEENKFFEDEALDELIELSYGFPHFVHQIGLCSFELSTTDAITFENVINGTFSENGAVNGLGEKFYQQESYRSIEDPRIKEILEILSVEIDSWKMKRDILKSYTSRESELNKGLKFLIEKSLIIQNPEIKTEYKILDKPFAAWIALKKKMQEFRENRERKLDEIIDSNIFGDEGE